MAFFSPFPMEPIVDLDAPISFMGREYKQLYADSHPLGPDAEIGSRQAAALRSMLNRKGAVADDFIAQQSRNEGIAYLMRASSSLSPDNPLGRNYRRAMADLDAVYRIIHPFGQKMYSNTADDSVVNTSLFLHGLSDLCATRCAIDVGNYDLAAMLLSNNMFFEGQPIAYDLDDARSGDFFPPQYLRTILDLASRGMDSDICDDSPLTLEGVLTSYKNHLDARLCLRQQTIRPERYEASSSSLAQEMDRTQLRSSKKGFGFELDRKVQLRREYKFVRNSLRRLRPYSLVKICEELIIGILPKGTSFSCFPRELVVHAAGDPGRPSMSVSVDSPSRFRFDFYSEEYHLAVLSLLHVSAYRSFFSRDTARLFFGKNDDARHLFAPPSRIL